MTESHPSESLGSPDETRGGPDVDAAVENAESGSQVEGVHTRPVRRANRVSRGWSSCAKSTRRPATTAPPAARRSTSRPSADSPGQVDLVL